MNSLDLILLIDDNEADNEYHELVIQRADITKRLKSVEDSRAALKYFRNCFNDDDNKEFPLPDLVFLDINMPALNGFELLDELRKLSDPHNKLNRMRIFMLTGSLNPDDYNRAMTQYHDLIKGFRIKPLTETIFLAIVQEYFKL